MRAGCRAAILLLPLLTAAAPASAWPTPLMHRLARDARRLLPNTLQALLAEREDKIFEAAYRFPPELSHTLAADLTRGALRPETVSLLQGHMKGFADAMGEKRIGEALILLGASFRVPADLADPVLSVGEAGYPPGVVREYYAFVEANLGKIPVVLEDRRALQLKSGELPQYWQSVLASSRAQSHVIREELFQKGRLVDHRTLDYRNPAFAVGSISYSRAVNAIAVTWLALWRDANGDTTRMPTPIPVKPSGADNPRE